MVEEEVEELDKILVVYLKLEQVVVEQDQTMPQLEELEQLIQEAEVEVEDIEYQVHLQVELEEQEVQVLLLLEPEVEYHQLRQELIHYQHCQRQQVVVKWLLSLFLVL
jgi:hypothetical protein